MRRFTIRFKAIIAANIDNIEVLKAFCIKAGLIVEEDNTTYRKVKSEYGWHRFDLDGRRVFTDYSTIVSSGGWRSGFHTSGSAKGLATIK
ncbi:putative transcription factor BES/BZR family [Helianthus annuus]|uniref:Putative BES1/BZR1 plant transcription factor n=1 Tax=Helianthus annuus TaxID=4232 RepID=A0A251RVN8_HELAN|nr:putative transcription factor BES/BZR family [Helianthus annuus]KAJ0436567.1 putative transcription factor BES/BZR family [Helianthus annuus]